MTFLHEGVFSESMEGGDEKNSEIKKVGIIGDGRFAEAIAYLISKINKDVEVVLWAHKEGRERDGKQGDTFRHAEGVPLSKNVRITHNAEEVISGADVLFSVVPTQHMRKVFEREDIKGLIQKNWKSIKAIISGTKGFEIGTNKRPSEVLQEILGNEKIDILEKLGVLSGLNFSEEILNDVPMGTNIVSKNEAVQKIATELLAQEGFDVFPKTDVCKAEVFGALKNVISIVTGAAKGLNYEDEEIDKLIEAGVSEINRFAIAFGIDHEPLNKNDYTMLDLVGTAKSSQSRNFQTGFTFVTQDKKEGMGVSEGVETVKSVIALAKEKNIKMPICEAVYEMVENKKDISQIVKDLLEKLEVLKRASQMKGAKEKKKKKNGEREK